VKRVARARCAWLGVVAITTALLLARIWHVLYIFTLIGFATWAFIGHLVTADDDAPGGWSNPDGAEPFPWAELAIKGVVLAFLGAVAAFVPFVRNLGGVP